MNVRNNSLFVSDEVIWMLHTVRKVIATEESGMTCDQIADNFLRDILTTQYPDLPLLYEEFCKAKQDAAATYKELEKNALERLKNGEVMVE